uniref:Uncharacterized protein B22L22.100 n=1 Tax=Neurospora crassa TaxID=5141 RepID=Q6MWT7_NEUCS|nr:hypothetical protein [Neurospora crassa]
MQNQHAIGRPEAQCHQRLEAIRAPNTDENGTYAPIERTDWDSQARIYDWDGEEGYSHLLTLTSTPIWLGFASNTRFNGTSTPHGHSVPMGFSHPTGAFTTGEARISFKLEIIRILGDILLEEVQNSLARRQETISRRFPVGTKSRSSSRSV